MKATLLSFTCIEWMMDAADFQFIEERRFIFSNRFLKKTFSWENDFN